MPELQAVLLAIVLGLGFGVFVHHMGSTWQRLAVFLFVLWIFQSASQHVYRIVALDESTHQLTYVATIRLIFATCACTVVWWLNRRTLR